MSAMAQHAGNTVGLTTTAASSARRVPHRRVTTSAAAPASSARSSAFLGGRVTTTGGSSSDVRTAAGAASRHRAPRRGPVRPAAVVGPNEVNELAGAALLTLSSAEAVLGKVSFGSLLTATSIYEYKAFFTDEKRAGKVEQAAMLGGNLALAALLAAGLVHLFTQV